MNGKTVIVIGNGFDLDLGWQFWQRCCAPSWDLPTDMALSTGPTRTRL